MIVGDGSVHSVRVLYDYTFTENSGDPVFREHRNWQLKRKKRHAMLAAADPEAAAAIHQNNTRRVIRALEILHVSGKTMCQSILKP